MREPHSLLLKAKLRFHSSERVQILRQALILAAVKHSDLEPGLVNMLHDAVGILIDGKVAAEQFSRALVSALRVAQPQSLETSCLLELALEALRLPDIQQVYRTCIGSLLQIVKPVTGPHKMHCRPCSTRLHVSAIQIVVHEHSPAALKSAHIVIEDSAY